MTETPLEVDYRYQLQRAIAAEAKLAEATAYAERLAVYIVANHFPENDVWKPLSGDLIGLLTQIDNALTGIVRDQNA